MTKHKVAVCVISTDNSYVYKAIIALLSVREKNKANKNFEYFVCGNISERYKKVIKRYNLQVLNIDLKHIFRYSEERSWPNECYWGCAIPEACYSMGYEHSIVLDGDVFCIGEVPVNSIEEIEELALREEAPAKSSHCRNILKEPKVIQAFDLKEKDYEERWTNSGVVIYNNRNLTKKSFQEAFIKIYRDLSEVTYCEADEVVFFLLKLKGNFEFYPLGRGWNNFFSGNFPEDKIIFLHLLYKPWKYRFLWKKVPSPAQNRIGIEEYQKRRIKYRKLYMDFARNIYKYKFYWYYIGDLLIPVKAILAGVLEFFRLKQTVKNLINTTTFYFLRDRDNL